MSHFVKLVINKVKIKIFDFFIIHLLFWKKKCMYDKVVLDFDNVALNIYIQGVP